MRDLRDLRKPEAMNLYLMKNTFTPQILGIKGLGLKMAACPSLPTKSYLFYYLSPLFVIELQLSQSLIDGHASYLRGRQMNKLLKSNVPFQRQ